MKAHHARYLAAIARGCGFPHATVVRTTSELVAVREHIHARAGLLFAVVKVSPDDLPRVLPPRDGGYLTERIRQALLHCIRRTLGEAIA